MAHPENRLIKSKWISIDIWCNIIPVLGEAGVGTGSEAEGGAGNNSTVPVVDCSPLETLGRYQNTYDWNFKYLVIVNIFEN